jgi:hypothetical protein
MTSDNPRSIVTFLHRPKRPPRKKAQAAAITGAAIVTAASSATRLSGTARKPTMARRPPLRRNRVEGVSVALAVLPRVSGGQSRLKRLNGVVATTPAQPDPEDGPAIRYPQRLGSTLARHNTSRAVEQEPSSWLVKFPPRHPVHYDLRPGFTRERRTVGGPRRVRRRRQGS